MSLSPTFRWILAFVVLCLCVAVGGAAWRFYNRVKIVPIAVGPNGFEDYAFASSLARILASDGAHVRLSLVATSGPVEAADKLRNGEAKLAIVRADSNVPDTARTVALLHSDPLVIVTPKGSGVTKPADLNNKTIGVIGPPGANAVLLDKMRKHYGIKLQSVELPQTSAAIGAALKDRKVDALLLVVPATRNSAIAEGWAAVRKASGKTLDFVPIDDAEAIANADSTYEDGTISEGQFGGSVPKEDVSTLLVPTYLVIDRDVPEILVSRFTRYLFESRSKIAADSPIAATMKTASTDADAAIPVHAGAKAFYDGEEQTLFERYGDWLYAGPVLLGALASLVMGIGRFLGLSKGPLEPPLLGGVPKAINAIKTAKTEDELDDIRAQIDSAVERLSTEAAEGRAEQNTAAIALAVNYLNRALAERRASLRQ